VFPSEAIAWCLAESGASLSDVDHVAINQGNLANQLKKLTYVLKERPQPRVSNGTQSGL
jgi:carbamoyltransferase